MPSPPSVVAVMQISSDAAHRQQPLVRHIPQLAYVPDAHDWCTSQGVAQAEASERRITCDKRHLVVELHALQHIVVKRPSRDLIVLSALRPAAQMTPSRHSACARSGCLSTRAPHSSQFSEQKV